MHAEILSVTNFLSNMMRNSGKVGSPQLLESFRQHLMEQLPIHYQDHWFPEKPSKGSAYRCIRINQTSQMDKLLVRVAHLSGLSLTTLQNALPRELTLWVDPDEVSCRFGEEGSVGMIYERSQSPYQSENEDSDSVSDSGVRSSGDESSISLSSSDSESNSFIAFSNPSGSWYTGR